jgi:hypothetical protein
MPRHRTSNEERFWRKVLRSYHWIYQGTLANGYGIFYFQTEEGPAQRIYAHRFSWEICIGEIPEGMMVLHAIHCIATRACVNPEHLYLGSYQENASDRSIQGRSGRSDTIVTPDKVREIRFLSNLGITQPELAVKFGLTQTSISVITSRKTWKHVA